MLEIKGEAMSEDGSSVDYSKVKTSEAFAQYKEIHFALNCGASNCPPIAVYDAESLAQDLETATEGFLEQSVTLNAETKSVNLSQLFQWYRVDFGKSDKEVLDWIKANGGSSVKAKFDKFEEFVGTGKTTIRYDTYNWGLNSK